MPDLSDARLFSIVIPTRNRAALLQQALASVTAQDIGGLDIIIVDDGSTGPDAEAGLALEAAHGHRVRWLRLPHRERGHGPAFSRNSGAMMALGKHLCFLDDDDLWTDPGHLRRCRDSMAAHHAPVDLYFSDQQAVFPDGRPHPGPLWLSGLEWRLAGACDKAGSQSVTPQDLLRAPGFAHLNCTVFRREFFAGLGGLDEALRYEEDRDMFYRAIDSAKHMLYNPAVVARHRIPDQSRAANASTQARQIDKHLQQLRICDKLITTSRHADLRKYGRVAKGHTLKLLAENLWAEGRRTEATYYMREALPVAFTAKWLAYTAVRTLQSSLWVQQRN